MGGFRDTDVGGRTAAVRVQCRIKAYKDKRIRHVEVGIENL